MALLRCVLLLACSGAAVLAVSEEVKLEIPASEEGVVSLINEVVHKATALRLKRNDAGLSDMSGILPCASV